MYRLKKTVLAAWAILIAMLIMAPAKTRSGPEPSGKDLYKQNCRLCHEKDSPNGEYSPMSLTQEQWRNFFKNKFESTHKGAVLEKTDKKLLEALTEKDLEILKKFVVDHAADSEQPQTCSD